MALRNKLVLFIAVLLFLLTLQWLLFVEHEKSLLTEETLERAGVLARTLAQLAREPLAGTQYSRLEEHIESVRLEKDVVYARIVNEEFRVLADTRKSEEGWIHSGKIAEEFSTRLSGSMIFARAPIEILGKVEGMAEIAFSVASMRDKISRNRIIFVEILLFQLAAGAAFFVLMRIQIIEPLRFLSETVTAAPPEAERHEVPVPRYASVEIRRMIEAVNEMRERIVTYRKASIAEATFAALGKAAANMAHEIRNPLEAMSGAVELLGSETAAGPRFEEYLGVIREEIRNLNEYLGEFLEFSRTAPADPAVLDLGALLQESLVLLGPLARKRGIRLEAARRGERVLCRVDGVQLKRVLVNLILNGIEACEAGGTVEVAAAREERTGVLRVLDDGAGFSKEALERAFEPYFTTKPEGTGLGLALSRRVAELHGGSIEISGRGNGRGTEVSVRLPLAEEGRHGADPADRR